MEGIMVALGVTISRAGSGRLTVTEERPLFFAERQRALLGIVTYLLAALLAFWLPLGGLLIIAILPVFYGLTSEGWRRPGSPARAVTGVLSEPGCARSVDGRPRSGLGHG